ncbi:MAG: arylamine N-acetyltransferase, partial [Eubacteriales bacterium]|nr:arylamine N-acetyltransferase [Eubacteriales bacterium]
RGGCCFELNGLFYELLKGLGFSVRAVAARVVWQKNVTPPVLHRAAIVQLEGKEYYCDIGYGGPGPKGLLELAQREQTVRGDRFTVEKNQQGWYVISRYHEGRFCPLLCVDDREAEEADFLLMNFYCAKSEKVLFTQKRIVNLCTEDGSAALTDDTLTIRKHKMDADGCAQTEVRQIICSNAEERSCILRTYFGL